MNNDKRHPRNNSKWAGRRYKGMLKYYYAIFHFHFTCWSSDTRIILHTLYISKNEPRTWNTTPQVTLSTGGNVLRCVEQHHDRHLLIHSAVPPPNDPYSNYIVWNLWITSSHSADRLSSSSISFCFWVITTFSIILFASSIQAISSSCGWGSTVWFFPIVSKYFSNYWRQDHVLLTSRSSRWRSTLHSRAKETPWIGRDCVLQTKYICWMSMHGWMQNPNRDARHLENSNTPGSLEMDLSCNFLHCGWSHFCRVPSLVAPKPMLGIACPQVCGKSLGVFN